VGERRTGGPFPQYFVVQSNFETESPGWKFWKWFRGEALKDVATNKVFRDKNDLIVDTASMCEFTDSRVNAPFPAMRRHDFGTTSTVHHTNYFEQPETLDFIMKRLV
jgi:hypothetical protein